MPVITHTALDSVVFPAGVETVGSNTRGSTINGLPTTAINITLDGINVQDKRGNEGFFMMLRPMMDSVEEITVSTSTLGAIPRARAARPSACRRARAEPLLRLALQHLAEPGRDTTLATLSPATKRGAGCGA